MERCPNCGNKLSNIDVLCPRCGTVVEVIQIKSTIASESAANLLNAESNVSKKNFPQSFVVYNEDFPVDAGSKESREANESPDFRAETEELPAVSPEPAEPRQSVMNIAQRLRESSAASESRYENTPVAAFENWPEEKSFEENKSVNNISPDNNPAEQTDEEENDYSTRYLDNLKNMKLPEIDDLQSFDPDEFMREYKRSKNNNMPSEEAPPVPVKKQWLEIEETGAAEEPAVISPPVAAATADSDAITERRYRSGYSREKEKQQPIRQQTIKQMPDKQQQPVKLLKRKKSNVMLSVLLWVVVSAAIFFCFIFFDKFVQKTYGSYDSFIYSITNGKVDINTDLE